ncbi:hypothetical protein C7399_1103 [Paraburkholderia tropica]|uniref:Origin recognition complex subunit 6 n=1 Tax=Paraburkholderia tropica TaxID=92647 RepID=A0ABX5MP37_9BURK|nr:hypothetical protein [Paraburkholderia tropica]PXX15213.1 hypothetical protein C7400_1103 [Paraburkholderia tropica]PZW80894.1 hypothetical protein C7399_1103 [Paraburkholderia tropica]
MSELNNNDRLRLGIKARCFELSRHLSKRYVMLNPDKTPTAFATELCHSIRRLDDATIDDPRTLLNLFLKPNDSAASLEQLPADPMFPVILSATFLLRALDAEAQGQHERGWNNLTDAAYWCGIAQGGRHVSLVQKEAVSDAQTRIAKRGGEARHDKERQTKEFAQQRARELCPDGGWRPKIEAARRIQTEVADYAKELGWTMVKDRVVGKIDEWLSEMHDAHLFFPTLRKKPESSG